MKISAISTVEFEIVNGEPIMHSTSVSMNIPPPLDENQYFDGDGNLNKFGVQAATATLIQGLIANMHGAHQNGLRDSAEHLRYIISQLEQGFVALVEVQR
jgi:hypothetical protein